MAKAGRPPKDWRRDPDANVIVYADAIQQMMPRMSRAAALKLSLLWHYHGEPLATRRLRDGHELDQFAGVPEGESEDGRPSEGFLRSEVRRVREKERRLAADPAFARWRSLALLTLHQASIDAAKK